MNPICADLVNLKISLDSVVSERAHFVAVPPRKPARHRADCTPGVGTSGPPHTPPPARAPLPGSRRPRLRVSPPPAAIGCSAGRQGGRRGVEGALPQSRPASWGRGAAGAGHGGRRRLAAVPL
ncbi:synaptic plasticity regulator PANTS isoform X1 [Canis lupus baileyi]|uniref:UPF0545 protein C22orf39 homolog isoform X1 n=1 Tax=Canis lupus dingo TaxID=286419 RepID=UPI0020C56C1C|nr:UPF0545 protein C22orf39 homolog isoform X1 [Canis lupus dingo]